MIMKQKKQANPKEGSLLEYSFERQNYEKCALKLG